MLGPSAVAWLGALGVGGGTPGPVVAHGDQDVVIEWLAPARCPSASAVQRSLTRTLVDSAVDPRGLRARAEVTEDESGGLTLALTLERNEEPVGQRTMQANDCDELATAAVLIVALAVDPSAKVDETPLEEGTQANVPPRDDDPVPLPPELEPADEPTPTPEPEPEPEPEPPPEAATTAPREPELHLGLQLGAGASFSVLSSPTAVISTAGAAWGRAWRAELGAEYWVPVETVLDGSTAGGRIQQWTADVRGCGLLRPGPLELPLCGGLDVGAVHGVGIGVTAPKRVTSLRLAVVASAALVWRPRRWKQRVGPWIGGDLLVSLVRARFRATPAAPGLVYHTPPVGGSASAGIEIRFR